MSLSIELDQAMLASLQDRLAALGDGRGRRVIAWSLSDVSRKIRTQAIRKLSSAMGIPQGVLRNRINQHDASPERLSASVWVGLWRISPMRLGARMSRYGVSIPGAAGGKRIWPSAFFATMPSGHTGVFERIGSKRVKTSRKGNIVWGQYPIKEVMIGLEPQASRIIEALVDEARPTLVPTIARKLDQLLASGKADVN